MIIVNTGDSEVFYVPQAQPITIGTALLFFSKDGARYAEVTSFDLPSMRPEEVQFWKKKGFTIVMAKRIGK